MGFPRRSTPRRWHGIGHPTTVEALTRLDVEIQRIQDGLADAGLLDITNIWVASDHVFAQHIGSVDLGALLAPFADTLDDGSPRIVAEGRRSGCRRPLGCGVPAGRRGSDSWKNKRSNLVPPVGLEPTTFGLRVRCSAN